jgi:hypothetical protein
MMDMTVMLTAPAPRKPNAQERRIAWVEELADLGLPNKRNQPRLAVARMRAEWRALGRSKGWQWAGQWLEAHWNEMVTRRPFENEQAGFEWLCIQSLIWFGREA